MKDLKISLKLLVSFGIVILLTVVVGVMSILFLQDSSSDTALLDTRASAAISSARLNRIIQEQRACYRDAFLARLFDNAEVLAVNNELMPTLDSNFLEEGETLLSLVTLPETITLCNRIMEDYAVYSSKRDALFAAISDPSVTDKEAEQLLIDIPNYVDPIVNDAIELTNLLDNQMSQMATEAAQTSTTVTWVVIGILVVAVAIAVFLCLYISRMISAPITMMMGFLKQVGDTGNLNFTEEEKARTVAETKYKDEISQSLTAFVKMMDQMIYYGESLEKVADQDLSIEVKTLGGNDTMGNALSKMLGNLNSAFGEISTAADQVGSGSSQIASAAQALASGTAEQAATVEKLAISMVEISTVVDKSAQSARKAADLSDSARAKAEAGSDQMRMMMESVQDISMASQRIGEVVKVIDDIAFQTNILALNAAVEAARAGQHGKGFAVVADEVRNLASKSAAAAKDTNDLIASSISKAAEGVKIAENTNRALLEIVGEIVQSSAMSTEIADSAESQASQVAQANTGLEQVSQVVQQNSATAEESAAASEELSGQSSLMREMVATFRLRSGQTQSRVHQTNSGSNRLSAPAYDRTEKGMALHNSADKY
ncbi:MAG: methyl-accepting chemotaxis protein [Clostridium sp.]|jgi:methyl-accepting chemotaxis protein|nr:methyl-accepting chemotaxis protein [Clostridium sp.]